MDRLKIVVETKAGVAEAGMSNLAEELTKQLKMALSVTPRVEVKHPGTMKQETIKAKRVLDLRKNRT